MIADMSSALDRQYIGAPGVSAGRVIVRELRCVGCRTTKPCSAQWFASGA